MSIKNSPQSHGRKGVRQRWVHILELNPVLEERRRGKGRGPRCHSLDLTTVLGETRSKKVVSILLWPQTFLPVGSAYNMSEPIIHAETLLKRPNTEELKPTLPSLSSAPGRKQRHEVWSLHPFSKSSLSPLPPRVFASPTKICSSKCWVKEQSTALQIGKTVPKQQIPSVASYSNRVEMVEVAQ